MSGIVAKHIRRGSTGPAKRHVEPIDLRNAAITIHHPRYEAFAGAKGKENFEASGIPTWGNGALGPLPESQCVWRCADQGRLTLHRLLS